MTFLIAEISNHHFGSLHKAKQLIRLAKESGADAVKGQAFVAKDMLEWGTMPLGFYEQCAFTLEQYKELIDYGNELGIAVFFTILSDELKDLDYYQTLHKLHAGGFEKYTREKIETYFNLNTFISVNQLRDDVPNVHNAQILFATPYLQDVNIRHYERVYHWFGEEIGVSHHGVSASKLFLLAKFYPLPVVEKHFYLGDQIAFEGKLYRDCSHSLMPAKFEILAGKLK